MDESDRDLEWLLNRVLGASGDEEHLGRLLDEFRPWLRMLAGRALDDRLAGRVDRSDIVQQTYLSAIRRFPEFDGSTVEELAGWLRKIQERNLIDETRKHIGVKGRSVDREVTRAASLAVEKSISASQRLMKGENAVELAQALTEIPGDQATAIRLRHLEGFSLDQIADDMNRTKRSIANLLHRGMGNLRDRLNLVIGEPSDAEASEQRPGEI